MNDRAVAGRRWSGTLRRQDVLEGLRHGPLGRQPAEQLEDGLQASGDLVRTIMNRIVGSTEPVRRSGWECSRSRKAHAFPHIPGLGRTTWLFKSREPPFSMGRAAERFAVDDRFVG